MIYEIEKNIPLPEHPLNKYPIAKMEIGDSFKFETKMRKSMQNTVSYYRRHVNEDFKCKIHAIDETYSRIWRIK